MRLRAMELLGRLSCCRLHTPRAAVGNGVCAVRPREFLQAREGRGPSFARRPGRAVASRMRGSVKGRLPSGSLFGGCAKRNLRAHQGGSGFCHSRQHRAVGGGGDSPVRTCPAALDWARGGTGIRWTGRPVGGAGLPGKPCQSRRHSPRRLLGHGRRHEDSHTSRRGAGLGT